MNNSDINYEDISLILNKDVDDLEINFDSEEIIESTKNYKILSIDIGIHNLAFSYSLVNNDFTIKNIIDIELIDISIFSHKKVKKKDCKLHHEKTFCDWIEHIFQEYDQFNEADYILIERQPPTGLVAIEQLIFSRFRNKSILIHPISIHTFFNMNNLTYEGRKEKSENIATSYLNQDNRNCLSNDNLDNLDKFLSFSRQHDVSDTILFTLYWLNKKNEEYNVVQKEKKFKKSTFKRGENINDWFDKFKYKPKPKP